MADVPTEIKKNVRSVLLSKVGGVFVSDFCKDYKHLLNEPLNYRGMGFQNITEFIKAMPDVVKLEFCENSMAYKMFGVAEPGVYMGIGAKKAQHRNDRNNNSSDARLKNGSEKLVPNKYGMYTVCYPRNKEPPEFGRKEVVEKFSEFGHVSEVNIIPSMFFIRYGSKEEAQASIDKYGPTLTVKPAQDKSSENTSSEASPETRNNKLVPNKVMDNETQVYVGNLINGLTKEQFHEMCAGYQVCNVKLVKSKDGKKTYGFLSFTDLESAERFISDKDGEFFLGRILNVRLSQSSAPDIGLDMKKDIKTQEECSTNMKEHRHVANYSFQSNKDEEEEWNDAVQQKMTAAMKPSPVTSPPISQLELSTASFHSSSSPSPVKLTERFQSGSAETTKSPLQQQSMVFVNSSRQLSPLKKSPYKNWPIQSEMKKMTPVKGQEVRKVPDTMPKLERINIQDDDGPPPLIPLATNQISESDITDEDEAVTVYVSNFAYNVTEEDLYNLMYPYGVIDISIKPRYEKRIQTGALVALKNLKMAELAILELDQSMFMNRPLYVNIAWNDPHYEEAGLPTGEEIHNLRCVVGSEGRKVAVLDEEESSKASGNMNMRRKEFTQNSPPYQANYRSWKRDGFSQKYVSGSYRNTPNKQSTAANLNMNMSASSLSLSSDECPIDIKSFSSLLLKFNMIMRKFGRVSRDHMLQPGMQIKAFITSVFDHQFFWAQIVDNPKAIEDLEGILRSLQFEETRTAPTKGLGRCAALFQGEWYRAWVTANRKENTIVDVFYVDYGNVDQIDHRNTMMTIPDVWQLMPMVRPFKNVGDQSVSKELESRVVIMEVVAVRADDTGHLTEVKILEVP